MTRLNGGMTLFQHRRILHGTSAIIDRQSGQWSSAVNTGICHLKDANLLNKIETSMHLFCYSAQMQD